MVLDRALVLLVVAHASQATDEHERRNEREHDRGIDAQLEQSAVEDRGRGFMLGALKGQLGANGQYLSHGADDSDYEKGLKL